MGEIFFTFFAREAVTRTYFLFDILALARVVRCILCQDNNSVFHKRLYYDCPNSAVLLFLVGSFFLLRLFDSNYCILLR